MIMMPSLPRRRVAVALAVPVLLLLVLLTYRRDRLVSSTLRYAQEQDLSVSPAHHAAHHDLPDLDTQREYASDDPPMAYDISARPPLTSIRVSLRTFPPALVPGSEAAMAKGGRRSFWGVKKHPRRRLVIVGDVHGMRDALEALLAKIGFDAGGNDHLILAGDLVDKGPDSAGVIDLAMRLGAHAVRGNHEDRVLLAHADMAGNFADGLGLRKTRRKRDGHYQDWEVEDLIKAEDEIKDGHDVVDEPTLDVSASVPRGDEMERAAAESLGSAHVSWLSDLPVILRLGPVKGFGGANDSDEQASPASGIATSELVVVHAGLVPRVPLRKQDPWAVMNMRSLVYPREELRQTVTRGKLARQKAILFDQSDRITKEKEAGHALPPLTPEQERERQLSLSRSARELIKTITGVEIDLALAGEKSRHPEKFAQDRDVAVPVEGRDGEEWTAAWARWQEELAGGKASEDGTPSETTVVVYGHDAKRGLQPDRFSVGLDSGCVRGGRLSALVIESDRHGDVSHSIEQVDCAAPATAATGAAEEG